MACVPEDGHLLRTSVNTCPSPPSASPTKLLPTPKCYEGRAREVGGGEAWCIRDREGGAQAPYNIAG